MSHFLITRTLELSTAHLSLDTRAWLDACAAGRGEGAPPMLTREEGWLIANGVVGDPDARAEHEASNPRALPPDLELCLRVAHENGCAWVLFDCDEDEQPGLPMYSDTNAIERDGWKPDTPKAQTLWLPGIPRAAAKIWKGDSLWGWPRGHAGLEGVDLRKLRAEGLRLNEDQWMAQR